MHSPCWAPPRYERTGALTTSAGTRKKIGKEKKKGIGRKVDVRRRCKHAICGACREGLQSWKTTAGFLGVGGVRAGGGGERGGRENRHHSTCGLLRTPAPRLPAILGERRRSRLTRYPPRDFTNRGFTTWQGFLPTIPPSPRPPLLMCCILPGYVPELGDSL